MTDEMATTQSGKATLRDYGTQEPTAARYSHRMREETSKQTRRERHRPVLRVERQGDDMDETMRKAIRQRLIA